MYLRINLRELLRNENREALREFSHLSMYPANKWKCSDLNSGSLTSEFALGNVMPYATINSSSHNYTSQVINNCQILCKWFMYIL